MLLIRLCIYVTDLERHSTFRGQLTVPLLQLQLDGDVDIDVGTRVDECTGLVEDDDVDIYVGTRVDECTGLVEDDDDVVFMCSSVLNILLSWLDIIFGSCKIPSRYSC